MPSFKNIAPGSRGIRGKDGQLVMVEPGQSVDLDVSDVELRDAREGGQFEVDGESGAEPGPLDGSVEALAEFLAGVEDEAEVDRLIEAEKGGKSRKSALAARKAELAS